MSLLDGFQLKRANVAEVIKNSQLSRARNLYEFDKLVENLDRTLTRQSRSAKQYVKTKEMMDKNPRLAETQATGITAMFIPGLKRWNPEFQDDDLIF